MSVVRKSYSVNLDDYKNRASNDYLEFPIPDELVEQLGWEPAPDLLVLRPVIERIPGDEDVVFVKVELAKETQADSYDFRQLSDDRDMRYRVTLPAGWQNTQEKFRIKQDEITNPFYGAEKGDTVFIEASEDETYLMIYHQDSYAEKHGVEIENPIIIGLAGLAASSILDREFVAITDLPRIMTTSDSVKIEGEAQREGLSDMAIQHQMPEMGNDVETLAEQEMDKDHGLIEAEFSPNKTGVHRLSMSTFAESRDENLLENLRSDENEVYEWMPTEGQRVFVWK